MFLQIPSLTERFVAFSAHVNLFSRVCQQMSPQMCTLAKWFFALCTFVWLLARVSPQVSPQWPARLNDLLHSAHLWGFSPLWVSRWVFRCAVRLNDVLYLVHLWAFSPEWVSSAHLMLCKAANLDVCMSPHKMRLASSLDRCRLASLTISAKWTFIQKICWFAHFCR